MQALSGEHLEGGMKRVVFSCSATGKPTPTIEGNLSDDGASSEGQCETTVTNSDHTTTRSCNITVEVPAGWSGHVDWLLNAGMTGQRSVRIPFSLGPGPPDQRDPGMHISHYVHRHVFCFTVTTTNYNRTTQEVPWLFWCTGRLGSKKCASD